MKFNSIMHVSFYAEDMERTRHFYEDILGCKPKMIVRYKEYRNRPDSGYYAKALTNPEDIAIVYFEIAPGQFVEFFPPEDSLGPHDVPFTHLGYSHFALLVDDIHETREELVKAGVAIDIEPKIGNSHTWQMWIHDPDGNRFEIMQYTDASYQITGHLG